MTSSPPPYFDAEDFNYPQYIEQQFTAAKAEAKRKLQRGQDLDEHMALVEQFGWKIKKSDYLHFWNPFWSKGDGSDEDEDVVVLVRQISREKLGG